VISHALAVPHLEAASSERVIESLARTLSEAGHVAPTFVKAALAREKKSPTGLPFAPHAVAIPHADPEHVLTAGIAIATLAAPVRFRQMGSPAVALDVSIVVMPALQVKEQAAAGLSRIIELLQDEAFRIELLACTEAPQLAEAFAKRWES
jgi:galactitol PTS system EIIA component